MIYPISRQTHAHRSPTTEVLQIRTPSQLQGLAKAVLIVHSRRILPFFQLRGLGADVRPKLRGNLGGICARI